MKQDLIFAIVGGDRRNDCAANKLENLGFETERFASENGKPLWKLRESRANVFLLPIPLSRDGNHLFAPGSEEKIPIAELLHMIPQEATIFAGNIGSISDPRITDYGKREDFAWRNAIPTAEGALLLAMQKSAATVFGMRVGIIGFGKVAKATARLFHAVGAEITVFARKAQARAEAHIMGYAVEELSVLGKRIGEYSLLINTAPARIFDCRTLSAMAKQAYLIELASAPFSLDFEEAARLGIRAECASGLPGKYFPKTAGEAVADTVLDILREKELLIEERFE